MSAKSEYYQQKGEYHHDRTRLHATGEQTVGKWDPLPLTTIDHDRKLVGEWFQRSEPTAPDPALLLKLLFANEKLSIQVHPDDQYAQSIGLPHGKSEAGTFFGRQQTPRWRAG